MQKKRKEVFSVGSIREEEKRNFIRAFVTYMQEFLQDANHHEVKLKKSKDGSVYFEFEEGDTIITRFFEEDIMFAYSIAIEAIYEYAKATGRLCIMADEEQAWVKLTKLPEES